MGILLKNIITQLQDLDKCMELELTNVCNAVCNMCPRSELTRPKGYMTDATFHTVLTRAKNFSMKSVSIGGMGEPLLHPAFFDYIASLRETLGNVKLTLTTNGLLLTDRNAEKLVKYNFEEISVSFHSCQAEKYRNILKIDFDTVVANIENFMAKHPEFVNHLQIAIVKTKMNRMEIEDIIGYWRQKGIKRFVILTAHNRAGYLTDHNLVDDAFYADADVQIRPGDRSYCREPGIVLKYVDWQGKVHICCNDLKGMAVMGDLSTESFAEIEEKRANVWSSSQDSFCRECNMVSTLLETEVIIDQ